MKQVPRGGDAEIKRGQKVRELIFRGSRGKGSEGKALGQHKLGAKVGLGAPSVQSFTNIPPVISRAPLSIVLPAGVL